MVKFRWRPGIDAMLAARDAAARSESSMNTIALTEEITPWSRQSRERSVVEISRPQSSAFTMTAAVAGSCASPAKMTRPRAVAASAVAVVDFDVLVLVRIHGLTVGPRLLRLHRSALQWRQSPARQLTGISRASPRGSTELSPGERFAGEFVLQPFHLLPPVKLNQFARYRPLCSSKESPKIPCPSARPRITNGFLVI